MRNSLLAATRRAAFTSRHIDVVSILCEVSNEIVISSNFEGVICFFADFVPVLCPVHKVIACVWCGGDSNLRAVFDSLLAAARRATVAGRHIDVVSILCKVRCKVAFSSYSEAIACLLADFLTVLCPVHKVVACAWRGRDDHICAMRNILLAAARRAAVAGCHIDVVSILCKVSDEIAVSSNLEGVIRGFANNVVALLPVHKVIAFIGYCLDGDLFTFFSRFLCAAHNTAFGRRCSEGDLVSFYLFRKDRFHSHI